MILRSLNLPKKQHFFLFGPRQTGKTTLVRNSFSADQLFEVNLLENKTYSTLKANPSILYSEVKALKPSCTHIFIDEVQKVPELLDEIQILIDEKIPQKFIISGSSARKLKRGQANLLGGRAWREVLFPLTLDELPQNYYLEQILSRGTLVPNVLADNDYESAMNLRSYSEVYLNEEIIAEGVSRNLGAFIRFLTIAAQCNGEQLNYANISRDVLMSAPSVKEYFTILEETLIGSFLPSFSFSERKKFKVSPKFYFFDTGVLRAMQGQLSVDLQPQTFAYGNYFETWIVNQVATISSYLRKDLKLSFLRTTNNAEVDLIIETPAGKVIGVEIKSKQVPDQRDFGAGFAALKSLVPNTSCICVYPGRNSRVAEDVSILPYAEFFQFVKSL
ncbi:MAG TPA: AAA family ATPase [Oligoflexia bacterium]|nr:AAA family ATPase [Oligoflexia bacterium]HMP48889.1 AAA family ATPase [Oligoflexia bacterium]